MKLKLGELIAASGLLLSAVSADPVTLWPTQAADDSTIRRALSSAPNANQRFAGVTSAHFFATASDIYETIRAGQEIEFGIPTREGDLEKKKCVLRRGNPIVPSALAAKFPDLKLLHCVTENKGELRIVLDQTRIDGLSASFFEAKTRRTFYVDNVLKDSDHYIIYDAETAAKEGLPPQFEEGEIPVSFSDLKFEFSNDERSLQSSEFPAYKFKLAPLANRQYSAFHGNTKTSVMAAIIECFSRVNGVYSREMGVYFVLIEDADVGICLDGDSRDACGRVSNGPSVIQVSGSILSDLGISTSSYDIGHVLTTGSGGVAYLGSLCNNRNKAGGTTGLPEPFTDVYYVDYVAHEIGHQLYGGHVFRDCAGRFDGNYMEMSAVEPGSGSSIMGYAGICGDNNVQGFSDPYFNNVNLQQMRDFVAQQGNNGCGEKILVENEVPVISVPNTCKVPVSNYFQLKGESLNQEEGENSFFSWDRSDTGYEDFDSPTLGSFRSWKPTTSKSRFFPNLFTLNFPTTELQRVEELPTAAREMQFRFTERRLYDTSAVAENFLTAIMGDFNYQDMTVEFTSAAKLSLVSPASASTIQAGETMDIQWDGVSGAGLTVEALIAVNTLSERPGERFDYEIDVKELSWESLGKADMVEGTMSVSIPAGYGGENVNIMLRSSFSEDVDSCFFFDLAVQVGVAEAAILDYSDNNRMMGVTLILFGFAAILGVIYAHLSTKTKKESVPQESIFVLDGKAGKEAPQGQVATQNPMLVGNDDIII